MGAEGMAHATEARPSRLGPLFLAASLWMAALALGVPEPVAQEPMPTEAPTRPPAATERPVDVLVASEPPRPATVSRSARQATVEDVRTAVRAAAAEFGQDAEAMLEVFWCESRWRNNVTGAAGERGFAQWLPQTWRWYGPRLGYTEEDAWDVRAQARLAALAWSEGYRRWWYC